MSDPQYGTNVTSMMYSRQYNISNPNSSSSPVYRPTSLDFINRPNPVEPQSVPQRHPLDGSITSQQLTLPPKRPVQQPRREFLNHLLDPIHNDDGERPPKRRKPADGSSIAGRDAVSARGANNTSLDLPKLPTVRQRVKLPPTLSGLHQPPPNAGLLPSISVGQPVPDASTAAPTECIPTTIDKVVQRANQTSSVHEPIGDPAALQTKVSNQGTKLKSAGETKQKRNKWTDEETACLLKGVSRFGIGSWTKILNCDDYHFDLRTALDLKDRFRVCCPDQYRGKGSKVLAWDDNRAADKRAASASASAEKDNATDSPSTSNSNKSTKATGSKTDRKSSRELQDLGINVPFVSTKRRRRHAYSEMEDEALLQGFKTYGNAWAAIRDDEALGLGERTATDLRDRMRTRYPNDYKNAGLAGRPKTFPKPAQRGDENGQSLTDNAVETQRIPSAKLTTRTDTTDNSTTVTDKRQNVQILHPPFSERNLQASDQREQITFPLTRQQNKKSVQQALPSSLFSYDHDVFFGALMPFADEDGFEDAAERITLDRGILDWPHDKAHSKNIAAGGGTYAGASDAHARLDGTGSGGIDPAVTIMKLPVLPGAVAPRPSHVVQAQQLPATQTNQTSGAGALPSLASVTALAAESNADSGAEEQLELPSLMLGGLEGDMGRSGGHHFLGFDELLK